MSSFNPYFIVPVVVIMNFVQIGLRAFQQRNVTHPMPTLWENALRVYPTSQGMAVGDYFNPIIAAWSGAHAYATGEWGLTIAILLAMGISGGAGCLTAMYTHMRMPNGKEKH